MREPRLDGSPIAKDGGFRYFEHLRGFGNVQTSEKTAFDHERLARIHPRQLVERGIEPQNIFVARADVPQRFVERHDGIIAASFQGVAATRRFDKELSHGSGGDSLEVQARGRGECGRGGELDPRLMNQRRRVERRRGVAALHHRGQPPQFFVRDAEKKVDVGARSKFFAGGDGFFAAFAHGGGEIA